MPPGKPDKETVSLWIHPRVPLLLRRQREKTKRQAGWAMPKGIWRRLWMDGKVAKREGQLVGVERLEPAGRPLFERVWPSSTYVALS